MPPKKGASKKAAAPKPDQEPKSDQPVPKKEEETAPATNGENDQSAPSGEPPASGPDNQPAKPGKKRKNASNDTPPSPRKASRRSGRGASKPQPSTLHLINYLLSPASVPSCSPADESDFTSTSPKARTYTTTPLTPFEELLSALILSRPISHRLGLRTIRTLLNAPYNFTSAKAVQDAGDEKRHQALWDARTQHKAKTAEQIGGLADAVLNGEFCSDGDQDGRELGKVREMKEKREFLQKNVKGLGKTGLDIFLRRVQWVWHEGIYPFVDERTGRALQVLGLPGEGQELVALIEEIWGKLEGKGQLTGEDEAMRKRRAFVVVLERATGADLEGKSEEVLEAAADAG